MNYTKKILITIIIVCCGETAAMGNSIGGFSPSEINDLFKKKLKIHYGSFVAFTEKGREFLKKYLKTPSKKEYFASQISKKKSSITNFIKQITNPYPKETCETMERIILNRNNNCRFDNAYDSQICIFLRDYYYYKALILLLLLATDLKSDPVKKLITDAIIYRLVNEDEGLSEPDVIKRLAKPETKKQIVDLFKEKICWELPISIIRKETKLNILNNMITCSPYTRFIASTDRGALTINNLLIPTETFSVETGGITSNIAFSNTELLFAFAVGQDVMIYDTKTYKKKCTVPHPKEVSYCTYGGDHYFATISGKSTISVFNLIDLKSLFTLNYGEEVKALALSKDNKIAVGSLDGSVKIIDYQSKRIFNLAKYKKSITQIMFNPAGTFLATISDADDPRIRLFCCKTLNSFFIKLPAPATMLTFNDNGTYIAIALSDSSIHVSEVEKFQKTIAFVPPAKSCTMAFNHKNELVVGSLDTGTFILHYFQFFADTYKEYFEESFKHAKEKFDKQHKKIYGTTSFEYGYKALPTSFETKFKENTKKIKMKKKKTWRQSIGEGLCPLVDEEQCKKLFDVPFTSRS
ncbi:MAG: hypothetical protein JW725_04335 [Candidatus Babeliaceae bacterium]|nr:hypothetical protein [Candidatus Babeliaceae bacterium]